MKVRITLNLRHGARQRHSLSNFTGFVIEDRVKPYDFTMAVRRLRLVDEASAVLAELVSAHDMQGDGDNRVIEGYELYQNGQYGNKMYVRQEWAVTVLDLMAKAPPPPKPEWPKEVELYRYIYIDESDGMECATRRPITAAQARRLNRASPIIDTREIVLMAEDGTVIREIDAPIMDLYSSRDQIRVPGIGMVWRSKATPEQIEAWKERRRKIYGPGHKD